MKNLSYLVGVGIGLASLITEDIPAQTKINQNSDSNTRTEIIKEDSIEKKLFDFYKNNFDNDINYSAFSDSLYAVNDTTITKLKETYKRFEDYSKESIKKLPFTMEPFKHMQLTEEEKKRVEQIPEFEKGRLKRYIQLKTFFKNAEEKEEEVYLINNYLFRIKNNAINHLKLKNYETYLIFKENEGIKPGRQ